MLVFTRNKISLSHRGISHLVLPLVITIVAVVGTYLVVASHADSVRPTKVVSVKYTTTRSSEQGQEDKNDNYCAVFHLNFTVKTVGKVDTVEIDDLSAVAVLPIAKLTHVGHSVWKGDGSVNVCNGIGHRPGKVKLFEDDMTATATYGKTQSGVLLKNRTVTLR